MAKFIVGTDLINTLRSWTNLLRNLTFSDNFRGYEWEGEIEAGETVKITHPLKIIPSRFVITDVTNSSPIIRPTTPKADNTFFYIKNTATTSTFSGKILVLP